MKSFLFALRLMALGIVFCLVGCGGDSGRDSERGVYKLRFSWHNTSTESVFFNGQDLTTEVSEAITIDPNVTDGTIVTSTYTSETTDILVAAFDDSVSGGQLGRKVVSGVHIAENKTTYIYVTYDGTTLNVDATREPGVL